MTFSLLKAQALLKARQHKYTHRKLIGRDPKTNRKRYRYYYAEHHGGGITSAEIEAGSAFKLTFKGRRGHFHVQSVEGDVVTVRHDGRPNSKPVEMTKAEFRALLKRQHETVENKKREKAQENRRRGRKKRKGSTRTKRKTAREVKEDQGAETPTVYGAHISEDDIRTYKRIAEEGRAALADMSDEEIERLRRQHGRNVDVRSRAVQDELDAAQKELKVIELEKELKRAEGRLTVHPILQRDRDEHARLAEEFARADAEYKRRNQEARKRHMYADPILNRDSEGAHHLIMEGYAREKKREAEEERRTKGSKLYQSLNIERAKGMRAKREEDQRRQRVYTRTPTEALSAVAKDYNPEDAYEIAERAIEDRPRDALAVADYIQASPKGGKFAQIPAELNMRLAELIHDEPSPSSSFTPREMDLYKIHSTLSIKEDRKKNGIRTKRSKREVEEALGKLREHVQQFYPEDDPTAFSEMRGQIRVAIEKEIAKYEKSLTEDSKDEKVIESVLERLYAISKGELPETVTAPEQTPQAQDPEQGADNLETMPEVESAPAQTTFPLLGMEDEIDYSIRTLIGGSTHTQATEKVARHLSDLNARAEQEIKQGADRAAVKKLFTEHARAFKELTQKLEDSTTPRKRAFVQKKMDTLLDNPPSVIRNEPAKGAISPEILDSKYTWFANRVPQAEDLGITPAERVDLITALEKYNERDRDSANEIAIEIRDNPKSASVQRAVRALLESQGETYRTMPEPDPSPAREQLTETARSGGLSTEDVKEMDEAVDRFRFTPEEIQSMNLDELAEIREAFTEVLRDPRRKYYNDPEYKALSEAHKTAVADKDRTLSEALDIMDEMNDMENRFNARHRDPLSDLIKPIDERLTRLQRNKRARERRAEKKQRAQEQAERQARREEQERKKREEQARIDEATNRRMIAQDDAREMLGESRKYSGSPSKGRKVQKSLNLLDLYKALRC